MSILRQQLTSIALPDIHGKTGTPIGDINYDLTRLVLNNINFGDSAISTVSGKGVDVKLVGISCHVALNWHYSTWLASDSGSADVTIRNTNIEVAVDVGAANERPTITVSGVGVYIGDMSIDIHGGASWLYQIFVNIFQGQIKDAVQDALRGAVTDTINEQAKDFLSTLPIDEPVDSVSMIDVGLEMTPTFTPSSLTTAHLGEFYSIKNPQECPSAHHTLPDSTTDEMVEMVLDPFLINSASFVYWANGGMMYDLEDKDVPPESPVRLNTTDFQDMIPNLYNAYPDRLMHLHLQADQYPEVTVDSDGIQGAMVASINVSVILPSGLAHVFTLGGVVNVAGEVHCDGEKIRGKVSFLSAQIKLSETVIGDFDVEPLQDIVDFLCTMGALPALNQYLANGFDVPSAEGVSLINPKIAYGPGYITISADLDYKPTIKTHAHNWDVSL
eukprot:GAFH01001690.1.p1 GENE.GAFH01001690.1~~GAFH01001690.1.p1  ORF type:complete len:490 (-),score=134.42 GAFH01001690.1:12-1343(-)